MAVFEAGEPGFGPLIPLRARYFPDGVRGVSLRFPAPAPTHFALLSGVPHDMLLCVLGDREEMNGLEWCA
jgi:hypothetical protein